MLFFKSKCKYCGNKLSKDCHEEKGMKFCCPNCASSYNEQVKNLDKKMGNKSCCH